MASFSDTKITPANGQKIPAVDGSTTGYMMSDELKAYVLSALGQPNGLATLDENGKLVTTQLPDFANDVLAFDSIASFPAVGADGVLYIARDTNQLYSWNGTEYVSVSADTTELEQRVGELETEVDVLNAEVDTLKEKNARQDAEIKTLQLMAEGTIGAKDTQSLDGYVVDVKARGVSGKVVGYGLLDAIEGRDEVLNLINEAPTEDGYYNVSGQFFSNASYRTYTIDVEGGRTYQRTGTWGGNVTYWNGTSFISGQINVVSSFTVPSGANKAKVATAVSNISPSLAVLGDLVNNAVTEVESRGANLWNEEWENGTISTGDGTDDDSLAMYIRSSYIPVKPSTNYVITSSIEKRIFFYDSSKNYLGFSNWNTATGFDTSAYPSVAYIRFVMYTTYGTTYNHDIAVIKGTSGSYTPYRTPVTLSLPSVCQDLHGLPTARDRLSFVNRTYENMKAVDLGSLNWVYDSVWTASLGDAVIPTDAITVANILSDTYYASYSSYLSQRVGCMAISPSGDIRVNNGSSTQRPTGILHYEATTGGQRYEARVLERNANIVTYDGSSDENWYDHGDGRAVFHISLPGLKASTDEFVCDRFTPRASAWSNDSTYAYSMGGNGSNTNNLYFNMIGTGISDVTAWRAWLAQHPVTVAYRLATPQLLDITDQLPAEQPLIEVEDGGTLTFVNENHVATPSTMTFPVQLGGTT